MDEEIWYCTECGRKYTHGKYCTYCGILRHDLRKDIVIEAVRDSVCMGDDCMAPHLEEFSCKGDTMLSDFMALLKDYVPAMKNVVWEVLCDEDCLGRLISDDKGKYKLELDFPDVRISDLPSKEIYCRYNP